MFLQTIKKNLQIEFLELQLDPKFSSSAENFRTNIRLDIVQRYNSILSGQEKINILNLNNLPLSQKLFFSISHTIDIGGYAASSTPIGFDIENINRINSKITQRVSTDKERISTSSNETLWTSKEATVKLLHSKVLMTDIEITKDLQKTANFYIASNLKQPNSKFFGYSSKFEKKYQIALYFGLGSSEK